MSAEIIDLRTPIHGPIKPLAGAHLEAYLDLCTLKEDWEKLEAKRRKALQLAAAQHEEARLAIERLNEQLAAIDRQRGAF